MLRSPLMLGMIVLLVLLVLAFSANFYLISSNDSSDRPYLGQASQLKVASQSIAKHAAMAAGGNVAAFAELASGRDQFNATLKSLKSAPAEVQKFVDQTSGIWSEITPRIEEIVSRQSAVTNIRETSADVNINMQLIHQENNKVVRALARAGTAANEIVTAQRQALLMERMGHTLDKAIDRGAEQSLRDQFARDSQTFRAILRGFRNGDANLVITKVTDQEILTSLNRIDELFRSVTSSSEDLINRSAEAVEVRNAAAAIYHQSVDFLLAIEDLESELASMKTGDAFASPEIGLGLGGGILVIFLVVTILVYRQSNSSVSETAQQNEENQAAILQLLDELADLADGDLRVQATVTESFTGAIADSINFSIDQMRGLVSKINETSGKVSSAADQTQNSVSALSEASQRQADEIADVSESVNEMAVSIDMVSYNAAESSSVAERSVDIASKGAGLVQNTIDGMDVIRGQIQETAKRIKRLGESSQEIGDIVALINDIADQTNILSLNAAIQASMAGDAGKGFAVVADEVQRLAERSGAAAKQISALVKTIQSDTNEAVSSMEQTTTEVVQGTRLAQDAGVALGEIEGVSKSLAEIIENISDAARQQAASAGKISNTMKSIQEITTATTDGTKETATAVGNLAEMTNELRSSVSGFKLPE
ncbi:MAG: methyl-accepting chemotaxis protein [Gammaproteobacteria bacterium]|nr:methyl-accepting chemotaxis protein [Gammaproteobacteria bacterium]MBT7372120.1 methyl-accepting chemotaxis protein [Gammaproteobacteria bacterium]